MNLFFYLQKSLNQILVPRFAQIENFIALQQTNFDEATMEEINFELSVLAQIVATLETPKQSKLNSLFGEFPNLI